MDICKEEAFHNDSFEMLSRIHGPGKYESDVRGFLIRIYMHKHMHNISYTYLDLRLIELELE